LKGENATFIVSLPHIYHQKQNNEIQHIISGKGKVRVGMEQISKQPSVTLQAARNQALWIKQISVSSGKKQKS
jgi:hypothetical protein